MYLKKGIQQIINKLMKDFLKLNHETNKKNKEAQQYAEITDMNKKKYQNLKQENIVLKNTIFKKTKRKDYKKEKDFRALLVNYENKR